jgi:hypothetical protein
MDLTSGIVWAILIIDGAALGLVGFWFSLRTLRWFTGVTSLILVIAITRFGLTHPEHTPADLVDAFLRGVDGVTSALLHPLWLGHRLPAPGVAGRWVIAVALLLGYRQLEALALSRQAPELDLSAISGARLTATPAGAANSAAEHGTARTSRGSTTARADHLATELRFRLPTMEVRAPAILPGGTKANALASIAESSGVSGAGMVSAVFRLAGLFWPSPSRVRARTWVESAQPFAGSRITVLLEDAKTGVTISTKTVAGDDLNEAASMVAGYIARQIFAMDRTVPPWCYGVADGRDLGAMQLARLERVYAACPVDVRLSRERQIGILRRSTGSVRTAGIVRYELAQLLVLQDQHLESLRLHALNRELHHRFYRGRYRLAMSLEMIANPAHYIPNTDDHAWEVLESILEILARCGLAKSTLTMSTEYLLPVRPTPGTNTPDRKRRVVGRPSAENSAPCLRVSRDLALELLNIAAADLHEVWTQLSLWHVVRDTLFRRDERAIWLPHWRQKQRQAFRDGVCVAQLFIEIRRTLAERDIKIYPPQVKDVSAPPTAQEKDPPDRPAPTEVASPKQDAHPKRSSLAGPRPDEKRKLPRHLRRAIRITTFIAGNGKLITEVLTKPHDQWPGSPEAAGLDATLTPTPWGRNRNNDRGREEDRTRWLPWQRRTVSWQAAYNTACLYSALTDAMRPTFAHPLEDLVITSLRRAVDNPLSELERSADWIGRDPDFYFMHENKGKIFTKFAKFLEDQGRQDYPVEYIFGECPVPHSAPVSAPAVPQEGSAKALPPILSPVPGPAPSEEWAQATAGTSKGTSNRLAGQEAVPAAGG